MLRLPPFRLHRPATVEEAARILSGEGAGEGAGEETVRVVAGGTDLYPNMKRRHQHAHRLVSLNGIGELTGIGNGGPGNELVVGATTTLTEIAGSALLRRRYPALARAAESISAPVLRNMGTLGGNLCLDTRCTYYNQNEEWRRSIDYCMKEVGKICWVAPGSPRCWAISAADSAPILCALGARVRLVAAAGGGIEERTIPVTELYQDDGIAYLTKRPEEIVTHVLLPAEADAGRAKSAFWKLRRRGSIDFAVLTVGAALWLDGGGAVERAAIHLGAVASFPTPATAAAEHLVGHPPTEERIAEAAALARKAGTPMDNTDFLAQWRGTMVERYTEAALREAVGLPQQRMAPNHL